MSDKLNVYQKLMVVRVEMQQIEIKKSGRNQNKKYFELADFLPQATKLFADNGLCAVICFEKEIAYMRVYDVETPDGVIVFSSPMSTAALPNCHPVQNLGAVHTYLRRYLWVLALDLVEHDALDATLGDPKFKPDTTTVEADPMFAEPVCVPPAYVKGGGVLAEVRELAESIGFDAPDIRDWANHKHGMAFAKLEPEQQTAMRDELAAKVAVYREIGTLMDAEHGTLPDGLTEAQKCERASTYIREKASDTKAFAGKPLRAPVATWNEWVKALEVSFTREHPE